MTWWYKGKQLGRQDLDRNFEIKAVKGPREEGIKGSDLTVTPLKPSYYGVYQCKAENPYGRVARYTRLLDLTCIVNRNCLPRDYTRGSARAVADTAGAFYNL